VRRDGGVLELSQSEKDGEVRDASVVDASLVLLFGVVTIFSLYWEGTL